MILLGEDDDGAYIEPLIDLNHYDLFASKPRCVRESEIGRIRRECYQAVRN